MPESNARCQSASSLERPASRSASRASESSVEQGLVLRADLLVEAASEVGGERRAPAAGADADDEVAPPDHRHQRKGAVGRIVGTVDPDPARLARRVHRRVRPPGSSVAVSASQAPSRSAGSNARSVQHEAAGVGPGPHLGDRRRARPPSTSAPRSSSGSILRAAMRPAPTTTHPAAAHQQVHRVAGERRDGRASRPATHRRVRSSRARRRVGAAPELVEGEDLQLDREVDLAHRHAVGHGEHRGREVEDRGDAGVDEAVGDLLGGRGGRGDDADRDRCAPRRPGEVVDRLDRRGRRPAGRRVAGSASTSATIRNPRAPKPR